MLTFGGGGNRVSEERKGVHQLCLQQVGPSLFNPIPQDKVAQYGLQLSASLCGQDGLKFMTILAYAPKTRRVPLCLVTTAGHLRMVVGYDCLLFFIFRYIGNV